MSLAGMTDAELEARVKEFADGLLKRHFWVSPEGDWRKWRVHTKGAGAILGVEAKTLLNARTDPNNRWHELPYERHRSGDRYVMATVIEFDDRNKDRLDAAA